MDILFDKRKENRFKTDHKVTLFSKNNEYDTNFINVSNEGVCVKGKFKDRKMYLNFFDELQNTLITLELKRIRYTDNETGYLIKKQSKAYKVFVYNLAF